MKVKSTLKRFPFIKTSSGLYNGEKLFTTIVHNNGCIYIYIYILYNPVNPELGIIPNWTNKIFKNRILNLNNPDKELNVNKIHRANDFLLKKSNN